MIVGVGGSGGSSAAGALIYRGAQSCSGNPNYPAATAGDVYTVSVTGKIGGASGITCEVGDTLTCIATASSGTQAGVGSSWVITQTNVVGALTSSVLDTDGTLAANSDSLVATQKAVKTHVATKQASSAILTALVTNASVSDKIPFTAAGSYMNAGFDNDTALAANSSGNVPTQHAVKAYVDASVPDRADLGLDTTDTPTFAGVSLNSSFSLADGVNIFINGGSTGTQISTHPAYKMGFWGVTPIIQPASANQATAGTMTTVGSNTGTAGAGLSLIGDTTSADQSAALMNDLRALQEDNAAQSVLLEAMRTALVNAGLMKGSA